MAYGAIPPPDIGDRSLPQLSYHLPNYGLHVIPLTREHAPEGLQRAAFDIYAAEIAGSSATNAAARDDADGLSSGEHVPC